MIKVARIFGTPVYFHWYSLLPFSLLVGIISILMINPGPMFYLLYVVGSFIVTFGVFGSILLHEIAHSGLAKYYGIRNDGIFWKAWGGQAKIHEEEIRTPNELFWVVIVGPLTNIVLAGVCFGIFTLSGFTLDMPYFLILHPQLSTISDYLLLWGFIWWGLFIVNALIGVSNLVTILPLDGGHIIKSLFWKLLRDQKKATLTVATLGIIQGIILVSVSYYLGYWFLCLGAWFFLTLAIGYWVYIRYPAKRWRYPEKLNRVLNLRITRRYQMTTQIEER